MSNVTTILFQDQPTNATSDEIGWPGGGESWWQIEGTTDGATVTIEARMDSEGVSAANFLPLEGLSIADATLTPTPFRSPRGRLRAVISGAGGSTSITVVVQS